MATCGPKKSGTAREFVLQILRLYADREMQVADQYDLAGGRFTKDNLANLMPKLLAEGLVTRTTDGRSAWWAVTSAGLTGAALEQHAPVPKPKRTQKPTATQRGSEQQPEPEVHHQ